MHRGDRADVDRVQLDAAELEPVVQGGDVGELAPSRSTASQSDDVEGAAFGIGQHGLKAGACTVLAPEIARSS